MIKEEKINKNIFYVLIFTSITIFIWIVLDVYRALTKKPPPEVLEKQMQPLDPKIDLEAIKSLEERISLTEEDLQKIPPERRTKFEVGGLATPSATPTR